MSDISDIWITRKRKLYLLRDERWQEGHIYRDEEFEPTENEGGLYPYSQHFCSCHFTMIVFSSLRTKQSSVTNLLLFLIYLIPVLFSRKTKWKHIKNWYITQQWKINWIRNLKQLFLWKRKLKVGSLWVVPYFQHIISKKSLTEWLFRTQISFPKYKFIRNDLVSMPNYIMELRYNNSSASLNPREKNHRV